MPCQFLFLEILPWDIFFDLLDKVIDGILIHAGLLLQKCLQLLRVLESRHEALDGVLVSEGGCQLGDGARVNIHLLQGLGEELLLLPLLQPDQGEQLALVLVEDFPGFVEEIS